MNLFRPHEILQRLEDFDAAAYYRDGYRLILLDVDNTIVPYWEVHADRRATDFIRSLQAIGFEVVLFTNNTKKRVAAIASQLSLSSMTFCLKPLPFAYGSACRKYHYTKDQMLAMGDQLLTDVLGGHLGGITAIYVKQITPKDNFKTRISRMIERYIFKHILHEKV